MVERIPVKFPDIFFAHPAGGEVHPHDRFQPFGVMEDEICPFVRGKAARKPNGQDLGAFSQ